MELIRHSKYRVIVIVNFIKNTPLKQTNVV